MARGVNILVVDSGGASSLSSLLILDEIMRRLQHALDLDEYPNVFEYFDIVAGTGTGAIIACLVGRLRVPVGQAILYYQRLGDVFSNKRPIKVDDGPFKIRKLADIMKGVVGEVTGGENTSMLDVGPDSGRCKTMVFAMSKHNMNAAIPSMLRSYKGATNQLSDCAIWEAACASMAHPELFSSFDVGQGPLRQSYVGGTLGCSNPIEHVLAEAKALFPDRCLSSVVSIGAGHTRTIRIKEPRILSILPTNAVIAMKDVAKDCEAAAQRMAVRFQQTQDVYFRFNVEQGMQDMGMCDWAKLGEVRAHTNAYMRQADIGARLDRAVHVIQERRGDISMGKIDGQIQRPATQWTGAVFYPAPTPVFTGREDTIKHVIHYLTGGDRKRCVFVLHGMGGSGKTQIALKVVEDTDGMWTDVVYVDATTRETTVKALEVFAQARSIGKTYQEALAYLGKKRERWLMVIDNADDPELNISDFLPRGSYGSILITSRLADMAKQGRGPRSDCQTSSMRANEALELLLKTARIDDNELRTEERNAADALLQDLGYLALAVVHAGAYIHSSCRTIRQYYQMFLAQRQATLDRYSEIRVKVDGYQKSVYTTWIMSYNRLDRETKEMMGLMANMHHSNITEDIFRRAAIQPYTNSMELLPPSDLELQANQDLSGYLKPYIGLDGTWDSGAFLSVVTKLRSYSLVNYDNINNSYSIHVLVHDWTRIMTTHSKELAVEHTACLLSASITQDNGAENLAYARSLEMHVSSVLGLGNKPNANSAIRFAYVYWLTGRWDKQEAMVQMALTASKKTLGERHLLVLKLMHALALTYSEQGRYREAEVIQALVVDVRKKKLGVKHPHTLESMHNLAFTYSDQGRYSEAEALQYIVVDARKEELGDQHPDALAAMHNLASTYSNQSRYSEAEALQRLVMDTYKRKLGDEHPDTLDCMHSLSITYSHQGRHNEAEELQRHVVDEYKKKLGDQHPDTLRSMCNLADTYSYRGRYNEAQTLYRKVIDAQKRVVGDEHPQTLVTKRGLALTYRDQARYEEAETLLVVTLRAMKRVLGPRHPSTILTMRELTRIYQSLGSQRQLALDALLRELGERELGE